MTALASPQFVEHFRTSIPKRTLSMSAHPLRRRTDFPSTVVGGGRLPREGRISPPLAAPEVTDCLHGALVLDFAGPHAVKRLATAANTNVRTAKDLLARKNGMSLTTLRNVATSGLAPTVRRYACQLLGIPDDGQADTDPNFQRAMAAAAAAYWAAKGRAGA